MKLYQKLSSALCLAWLCIGFTACQWEPEVAPVPTFDGTANTTIAELLAMHEIGSADSYDTIPSGTVITGVVTTSDEHGNCYKYINIEDGTGGIQIKIANTALYHRYAVGQRVYVKCDGLIIGDYRKLPQLGYWENDAVQPIPSNKASKYIFCDGMPMDLGDPEIFSPIGLSSIPAADAIPATYYNRLVRLDNATFVEGGAATYSLANAATSHDIRMADGSTITLRTSNYADFINEMLPTGTGTIYGILTRYNNYVQLVIRDLNDVQDFQAPVQRETIFQVGDYSNAFDAGWLRETSGVEWKSLTNNNFSGFYINAGSTPTDSWLISPEINLGNASDIELSFSHRAPFGGDNSAMKCYFTTNFTGNAATTHWTEIPVASFGTNFEGFSASLSASAANSHFRLAYRYNGSGTAWYLTSLKITAIVNH